jgi:hypothetical protein
MTKNKLRCFSANTWAVDQQANINLSRRKETAPIPKARRAQAAWPICVGVVVAYLGIALIGSGGWYSLGLWPRWPICLAGFTLLVAGFFLAWKDLSRVGNLPKEPMPDQPEPEVFYLGSFDLNGYSFKAYERGTANGGRQFRLISFPPLTPEREAAFIRYIVNEGLIENIWPETSKKLQEEANWAFLK